MLVSVGFTAKLNVSAQPGSMATLQKILATYAVSIVPGELKEIAHIITFHQQLPLLYILQSHGLTMILVNHTQLLAELPDHPIIYLTQA